MEKNDSANRVVGLLKGGFKIAKSLYDSVCNNYESAYRNLHGHPEGSRRNIENWSDEDLIKYYKSAGNIWERAIIREQIENNRNSRSQY